MPVSSDEPAPPPRRASWFTPFLMVACAALAVLVILLARQNRALRAQLTEAVQQRGRESIRVAEHLDSLPTFAPPIEQASSAPADALEFDDGRLGTVLFVFSSTCPACESMIGAAARFNVAGRDRGVFLIALQTDAREPANLTHTQFGFTVRGVPDIRSTWLRRLDSVPAFIIVDHTGVVRGTWWGVLDSAQEAEIAAIIDRAGTGWSDAPAPDHK